MSSTPKRRARRALMRRLAKIDRMTPAKATAAMAEILGPKRTAELVAEVDEALALKKD